LLDKAYPIGRSRKYYNEFARAKSGAIVLTDQHIAEALSRAYVRAIAGRAGLNLAIREYDYGVDGSFDEVVMRQNCR
jgi:hypothetical protein